MQGTQKKMIFSVSFYNIISIIKTALESSSPNECLNHDIRHQPLSDFCTVHFFTFIKLTQSQTETLLNIVSVELGPSSAELMPLGNNYRTSSALHWAWSWCSWLRAGEKKIVDITCLVPVLDANIY